MPVRHLSVDARRLERWLAGFAERHGATEVGPADGGLLCRAADGATAVLRPPLPAPQPPPDVGALVAWSLQPRRVAALLVRRGGYACAVTGPDDVTASKVGRRYVQGRTAAGGQSQQRFARRRDNQTEDVVRACADTALRVLDPGPGFDALLPGGDRLLVGRVLADPRLARLAALPRLPHLATGDPRADVVRSLPERVRSVAVELDEPG